MTLLVKDVTNWLLESAPKLESTVDGLKSGNETMEVTGIATVFMATYSIIKQANARGINLLITHEGIFYNHQDKVASESGDSVCQEKQRLINESGIAIFRLHDHVHRYQPDGITAGLVRELGWERYITEYKPAAAIVEIPAMTVREIGEYAKRTLGIPFVRVAGDLALSCSRIGLLVGYRGGGALNIPLFEQENLGLIIAGEGPEWETPEYVRDACSQGKPKALMLLGHAQSEEPGMKLLADKLKACFPGIPVHFISGQHDFNWI